MLKKMYSMTVDIIILLVLSLVMALIVSSSGPPKPVFVQHKVDKVYVYEDKKNDVLVYYLWQDGNSQPVVTTVKK